MINRMALKAKIAVSVVATAILEYCGYSLASMIEWAGPSIMGALIGGGIAIAAAIVAVVTVSFVRAIHDGRIAL